MSGKEYNEVEKRIIEQYQQDERMMILVFAQWCVNKDLDPVELYKKAYPLQAENAALRDGVALTVSKEESEPIADFTLLNVLSLFGNEDLSIVVSDYMHKGKAE